MEGALENNEKYAPSYDVSSINQFSKKCSLIVAHGEDVSVLSKVLISEGFSSADCARSLLGTRAILFRHLSNVLVNNANAGAWLQ